MHNKHLSPEVWIDDRLLAIEMKGEQPQQQTQTQQTSPWAGQQPFLTSGFQRSEDLYNTGGPKYYPSDATQPTSDPTIAAQSPNTLSAIQLEAQRGLNGSPVVQSANTMSLNQLAPGALYSNPGSAMYGQGAAAINPALGLSGMQALFGLPGQNALSGIANNYAPSYSQGAIGGVAQGAGFNDPTLAAMKSATFNDITNQYNQTLAPGVLGATEGHGRFGSGYGALQQAGAQRSLAQQLATAGTQFDQASYQAAANRQLSAAQQVQQAIDTQRQQQLGAASSMGNLGLGATGQFGQLGQQQTQNLLAGAQGISGNYNDALTNQFRLASIAPTLAQEDVKNLALVQDAGQQQDAYHQALINASIQRYNYGQTLPMQNLQAYLGNIAGNYGGTTTVTQPYYTRGGSQLGGALSGAASGAAMGSMILPGWGTALGAVGGGLMGAFS